MSKLESFFHSPNEPQTEHSRPATLSDIYLMTTSRFLKDFKHAFSVLKGNVPYAVGVAIPTTVAMLLTKDPLMQEKIINIAI